VKLKAELESKAAILSSEVNDEAGGRARELVKLKQHVTSDFVSSVIDAPKKFKSATDPLFLCQLDR
jgi:hypothetical protein